MLNRDFGNSCNSLTATLFHSFFVRKSVFYRKNIQYAYDFYGTDLYVNVCRGVFRIQLKICGGASMQKSHKESVIVDVPLVFKYASGIAFTLGLQNVSIYLIWPKSTSKICHCLLVSQINKRHVGLTLS